MDNLIIINFYRCYYLFALQRIEIFLKKNFDVDLLVHDILGTHLSNHSRNGSFLGFFKKTKSQKTEDNKFFFKFYLKLLTVRGYGILLQKYQNKKIDFVENFNGVVPLIALLKYSLGKRKSLL